MTYKLEWGNGPWELEPDEDDWYDQTTGLRCWAVRHWELGFWCGYVGVLPGHRLFRVSYDQISGIEVHGGLTWSGRFKRHMSRWSHGYWWLGFDCGHYTDLIPGLCVNREGWGYDFRRDGVYRDLEYVRGECAKLARQVRARAVGPKLKKESLYW